MPIKSFLKLVIIFSVFSGGAYGKNEFSKIYDPENNFCDIKCFEEVSNRCQTECECDLQRLNITDVINDLEPLPLPQIPCKDEDFVSVKWSIDNDIYFLEYTDENTTNYTNPTKCSLYTISDLQINTTYKIRLYSINRRAELSGVSEFAEVTTLAENTTPLQVPELNIKQLIPKDDSYEAIIEWSPAEDLSCSYDFVIFDGEDIFEHRVDKPEEFELYLADLQFNSTLQVGITARHEYTEEESEKQWFEFQIPSCLDTFKTVDKCVPDTPQNLTVEEDVMELNPKGESLSYTVKVQWAKPKYQPDYYIMTVQNIAPDTHKNNTHYEYNVTGDSIKAIAKGVELGLFYHVTLVAYSKAGASEPADVDKHIGGTRTVITTLAASNSSLTRILIIVSCVVFLLLVVVVALIFYNQFRKKKERARIRTEYLKELDEVTQTAKDMTNFDIEIVDYDDKWEVDQDKLILKATLGEGAFGIVRRAFFDVGKSEKLEVAIKMLKDSPTLDELREFYQEISIMKSVGHHPHIVSLIGCITRGRLRAPLLVVEYCAKGDLQTYLRSIWNSIINRASEAKTESKESSDTFFNKCYNFNSQETLIEPKDLISFAHQVTMGMEYLSNMKVLHRDLAARNVLVCEDKTVKVSDFGLSRDVYCDNVYCKTGAGKLPLKWMALESLTHQRYTTQSDVWSFGILLWEIVTLGGNPYAGESPSELLNLLQDGYRMEKPKNCSDELYAIMMSCWKASPKERPTFTSLRKMFDTLLSNMVDYLNINFSYADDQLYNIKPDANEHPETPSEKSASSVPDNEED